MDRSKHTRGQGGNLPDGLIVEGAPAERDPELVRLLQREVSEAFESPILGAVPSSRSLSEALVASDGQQSASLDGIVTADEASDRLLTGLDPRDGTAVETGPEDASAENQIEDPLGQGMLSLLLASDDLGHAADSSILDDEDSP